MSELIIREITPFGKPAKYGSVDLGSKENLSRGPAAVAGLTRVIPPGTHIVCVTFLPDTYHNRATLLEKSRSEKRKMEIFVRSDDGKVQLLTVAWLDEVFGDMEVHAAKIEPTLPPGASEDAFDNPDHSEEDGDPMTIALGAANVPEKPVKPPKKAGKAATKPGKPKPGQPVAPPEAEDETITIASLEDFLALPMRQQMLALAAGLPEELLQEIAVADAPGLEMDVKNAAFQRMNQPE